MRILIFGSGEFAIPTFRSIRHDAHEILAVVSQPDRPVGRGKQLTPTPLKKEALSAGVRVLTPPHVNDPAIVAELKSLGAELGFVAAFGQKIGPELLTAFPAGMINLHGSILPELRGAGPVQWAVLRGLPQTGVSVFRLVDRMDAGPILAARRTAIGADETADELHDRLARIGCDAVRAALDILAADPKSPGTPQDDSKATLAPKLKKNDGRIRFDRPARELANWINGLWSWPGAMCRFLSADARRDEIVTLARAIPYEGPPRPSGFPDDPGRISDVLAIQANDRECAILEIKPAGGRLMTWQDFVNGRHVRPGDRLVPLEGAIDER